MAHFFFHYFRSVMIDRFEKVLHIHYGQVEYWKVICLQTMKLRSSDLGSLAHYSQAVTRIQLDYKLQGAIWKTFPGVNGFNTKMLQISRAKTEQPIDLQRDHSAATGAT